MKDKWSQNHYLFETQLCYIQSKIPPLVKIWPLIWHTSHPNFGIFMTSYFLGDNEQMPILCWFTVCFQALPLQKDLFMELGPFYHMFRPCNITSVYWQAQCQATTRHQNYFALAQEKDSHQRKELWDMRKVRKGRHLSDYQSGGRKRVSLTVQ